MRKSQSGFTLIELVVVIVILGILGGLALPRFANLQAQARIAKMNGAMGAIRSASAMSHALLLANNYPQNATGNPGIAPLVGNDINVEGIDVVYVNGYPDASSIAGLGGITNADFGIAVDATGTFVTITPDVNHPNCTLIYTNAAGANAQPALAANLAVANCE